MEKLDNLYLNVESFSSIWPKREIIWRKGRRRVYKFLSPRNASHTKINLLRPGSIEPINKCVILEQAVYSPVELLFNIYMSGSILGSSKGISIEYSCNDRHGSAPILPIWMCLCTSVSTCTSLHVSLMSELPLKSVGTWAVKTRGVHLIHWQCPLHKELNHFECAFSY